MITRIHPLKAEVTFPEHIYMLGDTVPLTIRLTANEDVTIRKAIAELVCIERYVERYSIDMPHYEASPNLPPTMITENVTSPHKEKHVQGTGTIVENARLMAGTTTTYEAALEIEAEPPAHLEISSANWEIVVAFDLAHALDLVVKKKVNISM